MARACCRRASRCCRAIRKTAWPTRLLAQEHVIYPQAVRLFVEDRLSIEDGEVRIAETPLNI